MLGRFLSADPIIQDPYDTQSYNRYSYVRNNPLKYTDPSGHSWLSKIFKTLIQIIVAVVAYAVFGPASTFVGNLLGFTGMGLSPIALGAAMGATMGFAATLINRGSLSNAFGSMLKGALFGAISAGIANEIGNWAGGLESVGDGHSLSFFTEGSFAPALAKAAMHGIARGVIDTIQGGKFGAGFASGFVSSGFAVSQKWGTVESRTIVMAMAGGTTSQITGGKFANGAINGAFVHLFNHEAVRSIGGFVKHYFGDGSSRNVTDEYILSDSAQSKMSVFENQAIDSAKTNGSFYGWSRESTKVTWESTYLFSIGHSGNDLGIGNKGFYMSAGCSSGSCHFTYDLYDSFSDPLDIGMGLPFSKPYDLHGHWTKEISY